MRNRTILILSLLGLTLVSLVLVRQNPKGEAENKNYVEEDSPASNRQDEKGKADNVKSKASMFANSLPLPKDTLGDVHAEHAQPKNEILVELEGLISKEKTLYEEVFQQYQNAIDKYKELSLDFDSLLNDGEEPQTLTSIDKEMLDQAKEIYRLEKEANSAYLGLMAKYDEVIPLIMAKHF